MPILRPRSFVLVLSLSSVSAAAIVACTGNGNVAVDDDASTSTRDGSTAVDATATKDSAATTDAATFDPSKVCAQELAYFQTCDVDPKDITCTATNFEAWCKENQTKVDSEQRTRARAACLVAKNCAKNARNACIYTTYNTLTPSAAQAKLVADYCQTCEPGVATCATAHTRYDEAAGPDSIDDLYLAAWELADPLVTTIDQKCTGAAFADAGADAGTCARRFAICAADVYVDALPNCPK